MHERISPRRAAWLHALAALAALSPAADAQAFESAKVLPRGVRNVNLRTVDTNIDQKTDGVGTPRSLARPLDKALTFDRMANEEEDALKAQQLRGFVAGSGFSGSDSVGNFTADLNGHLTVAAAIASYGISDRLTVALGVPVYAADTSVQVGFKPNATATAFLTELAKPENNQVASAREAADKLNDAVGRLNRKLRNNGFRQLDNWSDRGLGDVTLAAKYRFVDQSVLGAATTGGIVAPTGRTDDPDILNDISFGDGQWDVFGQVSVDEEPVKDIVFNQHVKYTAQLPGKKSVRAVTSDEVIEVERQSVRFKLGDKLDAGTSLQWQPRFGLVTGIGYTFFQKVGDVYKDTSPESKEELQQDTFQRAHNGEVQLGYSTLPAFQAGEFAVPLEMKVTYVRQFASYNMPVTDLAQLDLNLFF